MGKFLCLASVLVLASSALAEETQWEVIGNDDGVKVSRKEMAGSDIVAFRGEAIVNTHIAKLVAVFKNGSLAVEWVEMLAHEETVHRFSDDKFIVYHRYDLSFPISDRDYVMEVRYRNEPDKKSFSSHFQSVKSPTKPADDCCIRAHVYNTFWRLTAKDGGQTQVEAEVFTDPKGWLPTWVVNMVQADWPRNSILALVDRASKPDVKPHPNHVDW